MVHIMKPGYRSIRPTIAVKKGIPIRSLFVMQEWRQESAGFTSLMLFARLLSIFSAVPSSPRNLQVVSSSTIGAVLAWISPEKDGNSPVIDYIVDVRLPNNTKWTALGSTLQTNFTTGALPVGESDFRVSARNAVGVSLPVEIDEVRVKQMIQGKSAEICRNANGVFGLVTAKHDCI